MSKNDLELAAMFTRALISFAYTGDPISPKSSGKQFKEWPAAFSNTPSQTEGTSPASIEIQVIGGPFGTGPAYFEGKEILQATNEDEGGDRGSASYLGADSMQQVLADVLGYGAMDSSRSKSRKKQIEKEDLFKRCAYIKSLAEVLDV